MITVGSRYTFEKPGILGTKPIVQVTEFADKVVRYSYVGNPKGLVMAQAVEQFTSLYPKKV